MLTLTRRTALLAGLLGMTDFADWQAPQAHADAISVTGVPLLTAAVVTVNQTFTTPGGGNGFSPVKAVTGIGYELLIESTIGAAATVPFVEVQVIWSYSVSGAVVATDSWVVPCNGGGTVFTSHITGPSKADQAQVQVINLDPSVTSTVNVILFANSRVYSADRCKWLNNLVKSSTVPGWTLPHLPDDESVLGMQSAASIPAGSSVAWLCGMHDGLVNFGIDLGAGVLTNLVAQVSAEPSSYYVANNPIYGQVNPPSNWQVACPRGPFRFQLHNNGTTALSVTWSAIRVPVT